MSFLYESVVDIYRPAAVSIAGVGAYDVVSDGSKVQSGLPASIQIDRTGRPAEPRLPGDPIGLPTHKILFPFAALPTKGLIRERDVVVDDEGKRYQVIVIEWTWIGTQVRAQLLET